MGTLLSSTLSTLLVAGSILGMAPRALSGQAAPVKVDPSWLTVNPPATAAGLTLVAGLTDANGGMNFDGATKGGLTLTVPVKWYVTLHFVNRDPNFPHSVEVTAFVDPVPATPGKPAFAGAASKDLSQGVATDSKEDVRFTADQAGSYLIVCGVPGHGTAGMWLRLVVSSTATKPELEATPSAY